MTLRLVIGVAVLSYVLRLVPLRDVVSAIGSSRPWLLALAFLAVIGSQLVIAARLRRLAAWYDGAGDHGGQVDDLDAVEGSGHGRRSMGLGCTGWDS